MNKEEKEQGVWVVYDLEANRLIQNLLSEKKFAFKFCPSLEVLNKCPREKFTETEITSMRKIIENKDVFDDDKTEALKEDSKKISTNSVNLAKLFLKCYDALDMTYYLFDDNKDKYSEKLGRFIKFYKEDVSLLREKLEKFGDGTDFGSYYLTQNIISIVESKRVDMLDLINLFFKLAGEEE